MTEKHGRLTIIEDTGRSNAARERLVVCLCDCGATVTASRRKVLNGNTQSCGCLRKERSAEASRKVLTVHGMHGTPEYQIWHGIKARCFLETDPAYAHYGGRGITMYGPWRDDFRLFFLAVGERPSKLHSIDRIDNDGNYEPGNVRWATDEEQSRNRGEYNVLVPLNGIMVTVAEWADATGKGRHVVYERLKRGWTPERAVSVPTRRHIRIK